MIIVTVAVVLLQAATMRANQVTVQELQVYPTEIADISVAGFYTGGVYAGVNKLLVNGTPMDGFCIDPFHFSSASPLLYTVEALSLAPKPPGTMGPAKAAEVDDLWAMYYSPNMTPTNAAGLQIAIWEIVAGSQITVIGTDFGASTMLSKVTAYTGAGADLVGLTGPGQDYVVQRTAAVSAPDQGSTLILLGVASAALLAAGTAQKKDACHLTTFRSLT